MVVADAQEEGGLAAGKITVTNEGLLSIQALLDRDVDSQASAQFPAPLICLPSLASLQVLATEVVQGFRNLSAPLLCHEICLYKALRLGTNVLGDTPVEKDAVVTATQGESSQFRKGSPQTFTFKCKLTDEMNQLHPVYPFRVSEAVGPVINRRRLPGDYSEHLPHHTQKISIKSTLPKLLGSFPYEI